MNMLILNYKKISLWFMLNKSSLNVRKTNYILFTSNRQKLDTGNLVIKIDDIIIENVEKIKLLGVIINSKLNWNDHIQRISKISKNMDIIFRTRNNLNRNTLLMLYHSIIQPYLDYCNIVLAVGGSYLDHLFKTKWLLSLYSENNFFCYFHCGRVATSDGMISLSRRRSSVRTRRPARWLFPLSHSFFQNIILGFRQAKLCLRV